MFTVYLYVLQEVIPGIVTRLCMSTIRIWPLDTMLPRKSVATLCQRAPLASLNSYDFYDQHVKASQNRFAVKLRLSVYVARGRSLAKARPALMLSIPFTYILSCADRK